MEKELGKVLDWLLANRLIINLRKTHTMLFTNKKVERNIIIKANNTVLEQKSECKFLGIMVDDDINWKSHLNYISSKISKTIALLRFLKYTFPKHILKTLYMSLIQPYLNYCNIIWGSADKTSLESLVVLQKKALRIVSKVPYLEHTEPLFISLKILTIQQMYTLSCILFIFKCLYSGQYNEFRNRLIRGNQYHSYNTRNNAYFRLPNISLKNVRQSFFYTGIKKWNTLGPDVFVFKSKLEFKANLTAFKSKIKAKLLNRTL